MGEFVFYEEKKTDPVSVRQVMFIVTIVLLACLALFKILVFFSENSVAEERQTVAKVKSGIDRYYIESVSAGRTPLYPAVLDAAHPGYAGEDNGLFTGVLVSSGITHKRWRKITDTVYQGPGGSFYQYRPVKGEFIEQKLVPAAAASNLKLARSSVNADFVERLRGQNVIIFSNGKKLIGAAAVLIPAYDGTSLLRGQSSAEETFAYLRGPIHAEITSAAKGRINDFEFGYYTVNPVNNKKDLMPIFGASGKRGLIADVLIESSDPVGFYVCSGADGSACYYTQSAYNPDGQQYIKVYPNDAFGKLTFACELDNESKKKDFQDVMITVSY